MSELEASNIRRRMLEGKLRKAERGALFSSVPTGYVRIDKERIEKDPDERVRSVLELVFRRFDELQSLRQVMLWLLDKGIELPARAHGGTRREVSWTRPTYSRVRDIMENPVYAGAYAFGRSVMRTEVRDGRKHVVQRKIPRPEDWAILIRDVGEWLVQEGHAIAAYSDRYIHVEREAREAKRGMWAHAHNFDPRAHRHREPRKG